MLELLRAVLWRVLRHIIMFLLVTLPPVRAGALSLDVRKPQEYRSFPGFLGLTGYQFGFSVTIRTLSKRRFKLRSA